MTAAFLTQLPLQAGGAIASAAGRLAVWTFARFMQAPLRNSALAALIGFSTIAGSNALYFQARHHPAPLFGASSGEAAIPKDVVPVMPATRHAPDATPVRSDAAGTEPGAKVAIAAPKVIGNAEVFEVQRKLQAFKLFDATIDGYFGPRTARAIKAFEIQQGLVPRGELTPEIANLILSTPIIQPAPEVRPLPTPDPLPMPAAMREAEPLPAPEPLPQVAEPRIMQPVAAAPTRELPETPQAAFNIAVDTAGDAIDTIIAGVQTMSMTKPNDALPKATAPVASAAAPAAPLPKLAAIAPPADTGLAKPAATQISAPSVSATDVELVSKVQRGLASLGFLHGTIDGVAGEATAKAIRNFEVYYNYDVTGRITPELLNLLVQNGAVI